MPYECSDETTHQRAAGNIEVHGPHGLRCGISHIRALRGDGLEWSAWTYDPTRDIGYEHELHQTRAEALDSLRHRAPWASLPDA